MRALCISPGRSGLLHSRSYAGFGFFGHWLALSCGCFSGHGLELKFEVKKTRAGRSAVSSRPGKLLGWLDIQPIEFGWNCRVGGVGVGEAVIPEAPFDGLGSGKPESTPCTPTFVKKGNSLGAKKVWMGDGVEDEVEHLGELGVGDEIFCGLVGHGVLEDGPRKNHALFLVTQKGNVDKENGETDLAVFFVPGLLHMHCDVLFRGRVEEGEDCTTCEEEAWEGEGVDVGTYHRWLVYNVKIRHIPEDKKLNPVFFQFIF